MGVDGGLAKSCGAKGMLPKPWQKVEG